MGLISFLKNLPRFALAKFEKLPRYDYTLFAKRGPVIIPFKLHTVTMTSCHGNSV